MPPSRYTEYESNALLFNDGKKRGRGKQREQFRFFANALARKRGSLHYKRRAHKSVEYLPVLILMPR